MQGPGLRCTVPTGRLAQSAKPRRRAGARRAVVHVSRFAARASRLRAAAAGGGRRVAAAAVTATTLTCLRNYARGWQLRSRRRQLLAARRSRGGAGLVKRASAFAYGTAPNCGHSSRPRSGDGGTWARARAVSPAPSPAVPRQAGSPELVASSRFLWARYGAPPGYKRAYARTPAALVLPTQGTPQGLSPGRALDTPAMDIAVTLFPRNLPLSLPLSQRP